MSLFGKRKDQKEEPDDRPASPEPRSSEPRERATATPSPAAGTGTPPERPAGPTTADRSAGSGRNVQSRGDATSPAKGGAVATIGKSITIKGELTGSEDLEIDGSVEGDVKLPDHVLKIGANGKVKASVVAKCVQVVGRVTGDVTATERVEVEASGIVEGDIRAPRLLVQEGAVINGAIEMTKAPGAAGAKPAATESKPASTEPSRKVG
jgi:cytoskeletal protein CcmA (bactofilin family)